MLNYSAIFSIFKFEMSRMKRTIGQSVASPVISTSLYFIVFGSAIGSRVSEISGITYAAFLVPGLIMLSLLTQSITNASLGIFFPRFTGTIYEVMSAPIGVIEITIGYVGAAACKSLFVAFLIYLTSKFFLNYEISHPFWVVALLILSALSFSLFGFIIGIVADNFEQLQVVPVLIITPLTFLGGTFYSLSMLPEFWQKVSLLNPVVYIVSALRWAFYGYSDVSVELSLFMILIFMMLCMGIIVWIFKSGYKLRD